ncbi:MAG TPA: hypothetical protein VFJ05_07075 [Nitrososphaeraceae archaeon]|nr:hypothetical protein [Nitrososphaeraceae archaeon]
MAKSQQIRQAEKNTIVKMLMNSRTDNDILSELKIPYRTFHRYKQQIYQDYADQFRQEQMSNVGYYSAKLHSKLTQYQSVLEAKLEKCTEVKDITALIDLAADLAKTVFELEMHKLEIIDDIKSLDNKMRPYVNSNSSSDIISNGTSFKTEIRLLPETKE